MIKFLLWLILLVVSWPLALVALVVWAILWVLLLPFRLVGGTVAGVLKLVWGVVRLPARAYGHLRSPASGRAVAGV